MKATSGIVYISLAQSTVFDKIQNEVTGYFSCLIFHQINSFYS